MSSHEEQHHTLFLLQGKGYDRRVWEVDIELIDDWLKAVDDDTFDQIGAAIEILAENGPGWEGRWSTRSSGRDIRT